MQKKDVVPDFSPSPETNAARFSSAQTGGGDLLSAAEARKIKNAGHKRAWKIANPEKVVAMSRKWYAANRDRLLAGTRAWQIANKDKVIAIGRKWYAENREKANARTRAWHKANREKVNEGRRKWRDANREKIKSQDRARRAANPEKSRETVRIRNAKKRAATIANPAELRAIAKWQARIRKLHTATCYWCAVEFNPRQKGAWHVDHIVAIARGGSHSAGNLCVACPTCNLRKHARSLSNWAGSLPQPLLAI